MFWNDFLEEETIKLRIEIPKLRSEIQELHRQNEILQKDNTEIKGMDFS